MINKLDEKRLFNGLNQSSGHKWISTDYLYSGDILELDSYELDFVRGGLGYTQFEENLLPSGSEIFSRMTRHTDYYLSRAEARLLTGERGPRLKDGDTTTEFGPGDGRKTRAIFAQNSDVHKLMYQAIDTSREFLDITATTLESLPNLRIGQLLANSFLSPNETLNRADSVFFFGSTISNFNLDEATSLLHHIKTEYLKEGGSLYLGQDGNQDVTSLSRCYDDSDSLIAIFCLGALLRIRRHYMRGLDLRRFSYHFRFNQEDHSAQCGIVSDSDHHALFCGAPIHFKRGEWIRIILSYKHPLSSIRQIATSSGFRLEETISSREGVRVHRLRA